MQRLWKNNDHTKCSKRGQFHNVTGPVELKIGQITGQSCISEPSTEAVMEVSGGIVSQICSGESFGAKHIYVVWDVGDFSKIRQITGVEMLFMTFYQ